MYPKGFSVFLAARCKQWQAWLVVLLLSIHTGMLAWNAYLHSPTFHEVGHLPAGISHLHFGRYELYRVNPPLVRTVAALSVLLLRPEVDWSNYDTYPTKRCEFVVGTDFLQANGARSFWLFTVARWSCIIFSLIGGIVCFLWANQLYGFSSGLTALTLWSFSPNIIGNGALIMPDAPAAALSIAACYRFWCWLKCPTWTNGIISGLVLGFAELTKTTLVVLYGIFPLLWVIYRCQSRKGVNHSRYSNDWLQLVLILVLSIQVLNMGYGFSDSFQRLGDFRFISASFTGFEREKLDNSSGNRFSDTWLGAVPVPLPKNYLLGIDQQKADFEVNTRCYLNGKWKDGGWWYFYLYALMLKVPLGTWCLIALAIISQFWHEYRFPWRDEGVLLVPALAILVLVSSQTALTIHMRYVIPILPFIFVWASKVAQSIHLQHVWISSLTGIFIFWSVVSGLCVYPHSLSYFNEFGGGPRRGHAYLLHSNIAWGQDILFLKSWLDENPKARPLHLVSRAWVNPHLAGIKFQLPPVGPASRACASIISDRPSKEIGPQPGWYVVDVNFLHGSDILINNNKGIWTNVINDCYNYVYFQHFEPTTTIGYSMYVYHITLEQANKVRQELGLPLINNDPEFIPQWNLEFGANADKEK